MSDERPSSTAFYDVAVSVRMTEAQRAEYRAKYRPMTAVGEGTGHVSVADDVADRLKADVIEALHSCHWLSEFATVSVSQPRVVKPE